MITKLARSMQLFKYQTEYIAGSPVHTA